MDIDREHFKNLVGKLLKYIMGRLNIKNPPRKLILKDNQENANKDWGWTGNYNPETTDITLFITNRHHVDILRSFAHEMIHHLQNEKGQLSKPAKPEDQYAQKDSHLRKMEKQAFLLGNMIFRDFQDIERFGKTEIVP